MTTSAFQQLAEKLDALPNGFPATTSGVELRILERLFTEEEANLAAQLQVDLEMPSEIAERTHSEQQAISPLLMSMAKKGLIKMSFKNGRLAFGLMPFVVGFYERQNPTIDAALAHLMEEYFQSASGQLFNMPPSMHRVIPIREAVPQDLEILPYESVLEIVSNARAWGVWDCICRKQKALIGDACPHPVDVCMVISAAAGDFDRSKVIQALTLQEALETLDRAAAAGLVHSVSNHQEGLTYICNCCTCACGFLRGIRQFGHANVIARSSFVNQVAVETCTACGACVDACQFGAITLDETAQVHETRCVGCGVCVPVCPAGALAIVKRPAEQVKAPPRTEEDWMQDRSRARQVNGLTGRMRH